MLGHVDGAYVAAQIRLLRQHKKGTILLVEGPSDVKVFERVVDGNSCEIEMSFGKPNLLEALDLLEDEGFEGVVAVADADFDRILGIKHKVENLCITDAHDLDLTIFMTSAFEKYLAEFGDQQRIKLEFDGDLQRLRNAIVDSCKPLSCCRLTSERRKLWLRFSNIVHDKLIHKATLQLKPEVLVTAVLAVSRTSCDEATLLAHLTWETRQSHDRYQLANGHDVAAALGIALRQKIGSRRDVHTWASEVEAGLRLAFDRSAFEETQLYQCLREWENNNHPYQILDQKQ